LKKVSAADLYALRTRPVSWTSPPTEVPAILDSKIEDTSEAAEISK
jgi:hypothetical protein